MTLEHFYEWLEKQPLKDRVVYMRTKYPWEEVWIDFNVYLRINEYGYYTWDGWEDAVQEVEVLGCILVDDIVVPLFNESEVN